MPIYEYKGQQYELADGLSNVEALTKIKKYLGEAEEPAKPVQKATQPEATSKSPSIWEEAGRQLGLTARAGITGVASLPGMVSDPLTALYNKITDSRVPLGTTELQSLLTKAGLPEPQDATERAVQAGASALTGMGGQAKLAGALGSKLLEPMTKSLGQQAAATGLASTAAQATSEQASKENYTPTQNIAASLSSGLLVGLAGAKGVRLASREALPNVTMQDIKNQARTAYSLVDNSGISIKPKPLIDTVSSIRKDLIDNYNFNPQLDSHRPIAQVLDQIENMVGTQRVSFTKFDQMRQAVNDLARESSDPATKRLAGTVVSAIDNKMVSLQPQELVAGQAALKDTVNAIKDARDAWRRAAKADVIENAIYKSEIAGSTPTAAEGEQVRLRFKQLAMDQNKMKLFNKEEQDAIRRIVSGTTGDTLLSMLARFNPERSQLMLGSQLFAATQSPKAAAATAALGFSADKLLAANMNRAAQEVKRGVLLGQIPKPPDNAAWRALIEARAREMADQEVQQQP